MNLKNLVLGVALALTVVAPVRAHTLKVDVQSANYWLGGANKAMGARNLNGARACLNNAFAYINDAKYHNYPGAVAGLEASADKLSGWLTAHGH